MSWEDIENNELDDLHSDDEDTTEHFDAESTGPAPQDKPNTDPLQDIQTPINHIPKVINKGIRDQEGIHIEGRDDESESKWDKYKV